MIRVLPLFNELYNDGEYMMSEDVSNFYMQCVKKIASYIARFLVIKCKLNYDKAYDILNNPNINHHFFSDNKKRMSKKIKRIMDKMIKTDKFNEYEFVDCILLNVEDYEITNYSDDIPDIVMFNYTETDVSQSAEIVFFLYNVKPIK